MLHAAVGKGRRARLLVVSVAARVGLLFCPPQSPAGGWTLPLVLGASHGPASVGRGRKDPGVLEKRFCALGWGLPLIFMILIYTVPTMEANASCVAMYISTSGVVNKLFCV